MDASILKTVGGIAGIGGIAIALAIIVFRNVILKEIFPKLDRNRGFKLLVLVCVLTGIIALAGIAAWTYATTANRQRDRSDLIETMLIKQDTPQQAPPPLPPENFPEPTDEAAIGLTDSDRVLDAYKSSFVNVRNATPDVLHVGFSYVPAQKAPTDLSPYKHWITPALSPGEEREHLMRNGGGYYHLSVFDAVQWHPMNEWTDLGVVPRRWIIVSKNHGQFRCTADFKEP